MIHLPQFIKHVIRPTLEHLDMGGRAAEELLVGTALQESRLTYLHQLGGGPARGVFQMEPATHNDIWQHYLSYKPDMVEKIRGLTLAAFPGPQEMEGNMYYAAAMCRVHYRRVPKALPAAGDLEAQADYWKEYYNTHLGAGTVEEYIENYQEGTFKMEWPT